MVDSFPSLAIFSLVAMAIKVGLVWTNPAKLSTSNGWFLGFFFALLSINVFELCCILYLEADPLAVFFLQAFHVGCIMAGVTLLGLILRMLGKSDRLTTVLLLVTAAPALAMVALPELGIAGATSLGYSITRIPGPFYWVFQIVFLSQLTLCFSLLLHDVVRGSSQPSKRRSKALLLAASPIFLVGFSVVLLMQVGFEINGALVSSLAVILFLIALVITEHEVISTGESPRQEPLYRYLSLYPATAEFRLTELVRKAVSENEKTDFQSSVCAFEKAVLTQILADCKGNKSLAARRLGISRATLQRKLSNQSSA
jgi:hypothetical protein